MNNQQSYDSYYDDKKPNVSQDFESQQDIRARAAEFDIQMEERKCKYGCIPTKRKSRNICLGACGLFLIILGILLYLFIPRYPNFQVKAVELRDKASPKKSFRIRPFDKKDLSKLVVNLDLTLSVDVLNTNRYDLTVNHLDLDIFILANITEINKPPGAEQLVPSQSGRARRKFKDEDSEVMMGTGRRNSSLLFPKNQNVSFSMDLNVEYKPNPKVEINDDVLFNEILQACGLLEGHPRRTMTVRYKAKAPIKGLEFYQSQLQNELKINCPFSEKQVNDIVRSVTRTDSGDEFDMKEDKDEKESETIAMGMKAHESKPAQPENGSGGDGQIVEMGMKARESEPDQTEKSGGDGQIVEMGMKRPAAPVKTTVRRERVVKSLALEEAHDDDKVVSSSK
jgi:hypothetical protein